MKIFTLILALSFSTAITAAPSRYIDNYSFKKSEMIVDEVDDDFDEEEELDIANLSEEKWGDLEEIISDDSPQLEIDEDDHASLPVEIDDVLAHDESLVARASPFDPIKEKTQAATQVIQVNFREVFRGSPVIYLLLLGLSIFSICIWLYSMMTIRNMELLPPDLIKDLRSKLIHNQFNEALDICVRDQHFFCKMLASGILVRKHGMNMMLDTMKAEGKRSTISFWQRIGLLNDIAIIAPMIGLLGTVLGMFYAFYDMNRSVESVSLLFDGLGISVGTTVAGLFVAIIAMVLHTTAKYRLVRVLTSVENEAQTFAALIDTRAPAYLEGLK